jgi:hypothetical protein
VFLVGDAAHIHLPVGGQGLNAGAQDAANLVWKFATEVQGRASKHLRTGPHSHEAERCPSPAGQPLAQDAASMNFTAANAALRDLLGELIDQRGDTAATLVGWLSALEAHYPAPAGAAHPLGGHRVPDLMTERGRLHSLLAPRHLLVGLDGRAVDAHHGPAAPHRHGPCSTPSCRRKFALQGNGRQRSHAEHDEGRGDVDPQITRTPEGAVRLADGVG